MNKMNSSELELCCGLLGHAEVIVVKLITSNLKFQYLTGLYCGILVIHCKF